MNGEPDCTTCRYRDFKPSDLDDAQFDILDHYFSMHFLNLKKGVIREFNDRIEEMLQEKTGWGRVELKERLDLIRDNMLDE